MAKFHIPVFVELSLILMGINVEAELLFFPFC